MIRVTKLTIHEFRGVRHLELDLADRNFAACGPNGTGKSGIVDAIEFALTGNISRLSGSGTGGLSVKQHGPHVDSRDKPDQASVTLEVTIPSLNKTAIIVRTVKDAGTPKITPDTEEIHRVFEHVSLHPEFVLSRRELIRYVLSEPGQRSKEVQALLRLDDIEKLRTILQKIQNAAARNVSPLERVMKDAGTHLGVALGGVELKAAKVLDAVNPKRELLSLKPLTALEANTNLKDGLASAEAGVAALRIAKVQAVADLKSLSEALAALKGDDFTEACKRVHEAASNLAKDASSLEGLSREELLRSALELFDEEHCPVCDTEWQPEAFRGVVDGKLKYFAEIAAKKKVLVSRTELRDQDR